MLRLYHNPQCSKSRAALSRLQAAGRHAEIVDYMAVPPAREQLRQLINKLDAPAARLLRLPADEAPAQADDIIDLLLASPELLQRPLLEDDTHAIIARPPERVDAFVSPATDAS